MSFFHKRIKTTKCCNPKFFEYGYPGNPDGNLIGLNGNVINIITS